MQSGAVPQTACGLVYDRRIRLPTLPQAATSSTPREATMTHLVTQLLHLVLAERLALHKLRNPSIDVIISRHLRRYLYRCKGKEG